MTEDLEAEGPIQTPRYKDGPWTSSELSQLRRDAHLGADALAALLERSPRAIRSAAQRHRISLRRKGERRGLLLGQPRGIAWEELRTLGASLQLLRAIRAEALAGALDLGELDRTVRRLARAINAELCPLCSQRPQETGTGLCRPCHLRQLAEAHRAVSAERLAERELWQARQDKHRRKDPRP